jgi:hypothetical protein
VTACTVPVEGLDIGDFHWDVLQDPEGNEFSIAKG